MFDVLPCWINVSSDSAPCCAGLACGVLFAAGPPRCVSCLRPVERGQEHCTVVAGARTASLNLSVVYPTVQFVCLHKRSRAHAMCAFVDRHR
eukprot:2883395-Pleurochrysis_carterae.AAC.2